MNQHNSSPKVTAQASFALERPLAAMRPILCLTMLCCLAGAGTAVAFDQPQVYTLKPKDRIMVFGDSTTVGGVGVAGYVQQISQALKEQLSDKDVTITAICKNTRTTNTLLGKGGWVVGLKDKQGQPDFPTVGIINLGLNDSKQGVAGVKPFCDNLRQAIALLREMKVDPILCTPTLWCGLTQTKPYGEAARALAAELKVPLIDLYEAYSDHVTRNMRDGKVLPGTGLFDTEEPVIGLHLGVLGETLSARTILQGLGLKPVWQKYQLRLTVAGKGQVTAEPKQPFYEPRAKVALKFVPEAGSTFKRWFNWEGTVRETAAQFTLTMDRHHWIIAEAPPEGQKK